MKKIFKKTAVAVFAVLIALGSAFSSSAKIEVNGSPYVNTNFIFDQTGTFDIMQVGDIMAGATPDQLFIDMLARAVERYKPDLIVFTGNIIDISLFNGKYEVPKLDVVRDSLAKIFEIPDKRGIPFALTFGESDCGGEVYKIGILNFCKQYNGCILADNDGGAVGCNYYKTIMAPGGIKPEYCLWFMDTLCTEDINESVKETGVSESQVSWYQKTSDMLTAQNDKNPVPSLIFQHKAEVDVKSANNENAKSSKFFDAVAQRGNVQAMFFADSSTSFSNTYKDVSLNVTGGASFDVKNDRGIRMINLNMNDGDKFTTSFKSFSDIFNLNVSAYLRYWFGACNTKVAAWILLGVLAAAIAVMIILLIIKKSGKRKEKKIAVRKKQEKNSQRKNHKNKKNPKK